MLPSTNFLFSSIIFLIFLFQNHRFIVFGLNLTELGNLASRIKLGALWNLEQMAWCRIGVSAGLAFNGYGCWCGRGGSGNTVDEIDVCCQQHDICYDWVYANKMCHSTLSEYVSQYEWNCVPPVVKGFRPAVMCAEEKNKGCGQQICRCDQQLVNCWATQPSPKCKKECKTGKCENEKQNGTATLNIFEGIFVGGLEEILAQIGQQNWTNNNNNNISLVEMLSPLKDPTMGQMHV